jgi:hypothetical protein
MRHAKNIERREVSCLFVTDITKVLLMTKDGVNWHFPQERIRFNANGERLETRQEAIGRLCSQFDMNSPEEDTFLEVTAEHMSHEDVATTYHIFTTEPKNLKKTELEAAGERCEWTDSPFTFNLNQCTKETLEKHGFS